MSSGSSILEETDFTSGASSRILNSSQRTQEALDRIFEGWDRLLDLLNNQSQREQLRVDLFEQIPDSWRLFLPAAVFVLFVVLFAGITIGSHIFAWGVTRASASKKGASNNGSSSSTIRYYTVTQSCISMICYSIIVTIEIFVIIWIGNGALFEDWENMVNRKYDYMDGCVASAILYWSQFAYYAVALAAFLFHRGNYASRGHVALDVAHHIASIALMTISWRFKIHRIGMMLMILLDPTDILISAAKLAREFGFRRIGTFIFFVFAALWFYMRVYCYTIYLMMPLAFDVIHVRQRDELYYNSTAHFLTYIILAIVYVMQLVWTWYIAKIVWRTFRTGEAVDIRDEEHDNDGNGNKNKNVSTGSTFIENDNGEDIIKIESSSSIQKTNSSSVRNRKK